MSGEKQVQRPSDVLSRYLSMSTWRKKGREHKSKASHESGVGRSKKRSRLGNSKQRAIYTAAHGHKHRDYGFLCARADELNRR